MHKYSPKGLIKLLTLFAALTSLTGCSDPSLPSLIEKIKQQVDQNGSVFPNESVENTNRRGSKQEAAPQSAKPNKMIDAKEVAARTAPVIAQNPENRIVRKDTLCSPELFKDTLNKIMGEAASKGYISKTEQYVLIVGVTVMPIGHDNNNLVWKELWTLKTKQKTINYPLVFVGDGVGGTFFLGLKPYES